MDPLDLTALIVWLLSIFGGITIGVQKGQELSGIIWPILFGPIGLIIVLCLPNLKKRAREAAQSELQAQQLELQRQQLEEMRALRESAVRPAAPVPQARPVPKIKLAKNGEEWGDFSLEDIRTLVESGEMTLADYYFSPPANDWLTLDHLPL